MPEKRESPEGVYGAVPRGPRDKAKALLPESQSPAVEHAHPLLQRLHRSATRGGPFKFRGPPPPPGQAMTSEVIEGDEWDAYVTLDTFSTGGTRDRLRGASPTATESP